jgi:two-component system, OmpR family, aerobic respiration control sensor histidine kinase ArcB
MERNMIQVLLVEDNPMIATAISYLVTKLGHQIKVVCDATSGLATSKKQSFDLILMDIWLPDGTGDQVALQIRQDATEPQSGNADYCSDVTCR